MVILTIEVRAKAARHDVRARQLAQEITHTLIPGIPFPLSLRTAQLYRLSVEETFSDTHLDMLISQLLIDPVVQEAFVNTDANSTETTAFPTSWHTIDVFFHAGVTDTLAESVIAGAHLLNIPGLQRVETGQRYLLDASLSEAAVHTISRSLLYNPVIQDHALHLAGSSATLPAHTTPDYASTPPVQVASSAVQTFPLSSMSDEALLALSKQGMLALNLDEMQALQAYFRREGREPTDVELETLAQTWSEHCSHKTFRATIEYRELDDEGDMLAQERIPGLLKHYLMRATEQVRHPLVVSAFRDNAGVIRFTEEMDIAFKVETHNHPSAIEPFGGANTGVGGVIRDVLGVSAQPIACTDVLCFGPPETPTESLPVGVLSPRRVASGVINGVRDYGNKMGIPTVNGAVLYHEGYICNPLVFCGCLGMLPHGSHPQQARPGDLIVALGGRTGRDGIHGATFSSGEMSSETLASAGSAVQIGAPITEKKVSAVILAARDRQLYTAITDCGAGGFSSAIGEMGAETGARVELANAPLKYTGLAPWEIWLSEAQERMVLAVPPAHIEELRAICAIEEVEATVLGSFTSDSRLIVTYQGHIVADLDMAFLHNGRPAPTLEAVWINYTAQAEPTNPSASFDKSTNPSASFDKPTNPSASFDKSTNPSASFDKSTNPSAFDKPTNPSAFDKPTNPSAFDKPTNPSASFDKSTNPSAFDKPTNPSAFDKPTNPSASFDKPTNPSASFDKPTNTPVGADFIARTADLSAPMACVTSKSVDRVTGADKSAVRAINRRLREGFSPKSLQTALLALLSSPTIASKEDVVRRYDHEVQGATIGKPLVGRAGNGPGDAAVLQPILDGLTNANTSAGIVLSNGINPLYGRIDPYQMALNAVDEALRNLTAVGGDIERAALLDNFCWGNPNDPHQLGMLVRAVQGCYDAAVGFGTPFISGKDSLNNEYRSGEQRMPVIPTLLISAVGVIDDVAQTIDMSLKAPGNLLYQIGTTRNELAASYYAAISPLPADLARQTRVPHVDVAHARVSMNALGKVIRRGLVQSCHDLSEGGLAIAAAEMSLAGLLGMSIDVGGISVVRARADGEARVGEEARADGETRAEASSAPTNLRGSDGASRLVGAELASALAQYNDIIALFSESPSRFLVEIAPQEQAAFESFMREQGVQDIYLIGVVTEEPQYIVRHGEAVLIDTPVAVLQSAWKGEQA